MARAAPKSSPRFRMRSMKRKIGIIHGTKFFHNRLLGHAARVNWLVAVSHLAWHQPFHNNAYPNKFAKLRSASDPRLLKFRQSSNCSKKRCSFSAVSAVNPAPPVRYKSL